jgi:programmed cell death protein 5
VGEIMSASDDELERLRAARKAEIQQQFESQAEQQMQVEAQEQADSQELSALSEAMKIILTPEARQRLAAVEMTREDVALGVKRHLLNLHGQNRLQVPIDDETLKGVLAQLSSNRRESTIRRI